MKYYCGSEDIDRVLKIIPGISSLRYRSVFITGSSGMICSSVVELLLRINETQNAGIKVYLAGRSQERIQKRFASFKEGQDYYFIQYDATKDELPCVPTDYIVYGAGNASPHMFRMQPVETMLANLVGLNCTLNMAVRTGTRRFLYISSSEVYGQNKDVELLSEKDYGYVDILNPRSAYPSAKRAAETLCIAYGDEYGLDTVVVRPGHIYGPTITDTDDRASAQFTRAAIRGEMIVMKSPGQQRRSYCYVLDCASAILTVLLNGKKGNAYNISNRNSIISIRGVAEALAKETGTSIQFCDPSDVEKKGYNLMDNAVLDASELEKLQWKGEFDLDEGIQRTVSLLKRKKNHG